MKLQRATKISPTPSTTLVQIMSSTVDASATEVFRGSIAAGNDQYRPWHHRTGERADPLPIRGRPASFVDGAPAAGSSGTSQARRLHRDSFHERREHRSFSTEWISSPLLEGFASFHSALNSVQEIASNLGTSTSSHDDMNCSLPYLGTCWSQDHSGESSVGSSRSTQSSFISTDTSMASSAESPSLALDDWDIIKSRSLSTDMASPGSMESFMPFLFPMDHEGSVPHQAGSLPPAHSPLFGSSEHHMPPLSTGLCEVDGQTRDSSAQVCVAPSYVDMKPEHRTRASPALWSLDHEQPTTSTEGHLYGSPPPAVHPRFGGQTSVFGMPAAPVPRALLQQLPSHQHPRAPLTVTDPSSLGLASTPSHPLMQMAMAPVSSSTVHAVPATSSTLPLADIQLLTKLNQCYWKNGRKNLQCFPICPEHMDFYSMKMSNQKHTSVGVCRGPVYTHVFLPACPPNAKPPRSTGQHMKYEYGVGASGTGGSAFEVFVLGKFERVPQRDENNALQELLPKPDDFTSSSDFEAFRYACFQAVEMEERRVTTRATPDVAGLPDHIVRSTWFFLPDVWKVQPMLKKKRKATRSAPAQSYPFCFRVFVYVREPGDDSGTYRCLATAASSFFELYSTRTVDRVKRKYWGRADDEAALATTPSATHIAKRSTRL